VNFVTLIRQWANSGDMMHSCERDMDLRELKFRISPWLALALGVMWIVAELVGNGSNVAWRDLYPGVSLISASFVLFWVVRWLNRPFDFERRESSENPDPERTDW
jgi:hypothetical protein